MNHDKHSSRHSDSYHFWSRLVAIILAIVLAVLWLMGYGPFHKANGSQQCCGVDSVATLAADTAGAAATAGAVTTATTASSATTAPAAAGFAGVAIDAATGKVTLSGEVSSDAEKQSLLAKASTTYGADKVIDALTVKSGLATLGAVTLTGNTASEATKLAAGESAKATFAPATIDNQLVVMQAPTPTPAAVTAVAATVVDTAKTVAPAVCGDALKASVGFATGSAQLSKAGQQALDAMVACLPQGGAITGHTDNVGQAESNQRLSERRAQAVRTYLMHKGIKNLSAKGAGATAPVASNDTNEGRAQNRRMEIVPQ